MKKIIAAVLAAVLCFAALVGCGEQKTSLSPKETLKEMTDKVTFESAMIDLGDEQIENQFGYTTDDYVEGVFAQSEDVLKAEFIIIIQLKDNAKADEVKKKLDQYVDERIRVFGSYMPDQVPVLEKAVVVEKGNYVYLISSEKVDELKKIAEECIR